VTRLTDALHEVADPLPGYDVLEGAVVQGRRRKRWGAAASALGVLAVLGLVAAVVTPLTGDDAGIAVASDRPSIPEHIGPPAPFTRDASDSPPGPASLIFTDSRGRLVAVGATQDSYRLIDVDRPARAGEDAALSPAGDKVALSRGFEVAVVDLVRGGTRTYGPSDAAVDSFDPLVWLPDGTGLVVKEYTQADDPTTQGNSQRLSVLDLATGTLDAFAEATWNLATPGFSVAVSPDGKRIAYQFYDFITVYHRSTGAKVRIDLTAPPDTPDDGCGPNQAVLAGRAAWAPEGSLTLVCETFESDRYRWQLRLVDPASGALRGTRSLPAALAPAPGPGLVRLIGWSGGDPVVVVYSGGRNRAGIMGFGYVNTTDFDGTVGVHLGVLPLVQPVEGVVAIDVAENLLADPRTRPGDPPWSLPFPPPPDWLMIVGPVLFVTLLALLVLAIRRGRVR
jgi:hypothetical protein